ncbi:Cyclodextrin-binding protein [subsurface metagenome]
MKEMKGVAPVAIAAVIIVAVVVAVAAYVYLKPEEEPPEKVTLTVWCSLEEEEVDFEEDLVSSLFNEEYPNIEVNIEAVPEMKDAVLISIPAGGGPDLFMFAHDLTGTLAEGGYIVPIDNFVTTELQEKFPEAAFKAGEYKGELYALPFAAETVIFFYNKELLGDRPVPETTDELVDIMADLYNPDEGMYGMSYPINPYFMSGWVHAFGGYYWDDATGTAGVNSTGTKNAVDWILEKFQPYMSTDISWDVQLALFSEGKAPFAINGPWMIKSWEDAGIDFGLATIPKISELNKDPMPLTGVKVMWMNKNCEHREEAFAFMEWFTTNEEHIVERAKEFGYIPVLKSAMENPVVQASPKLSIVSEQVSLGVPMASGPEMELCWDPIISAVDIIWAGTQSVEAALDEAQTTILERIG